MKNKVEIKYTVGEGEDAVEKTLIVRKPNAKNLREAKVVYAREFNNALKSGAILEARLDDYMREQEIWNEEKQKRVLDVLTELGECLDKLAAGGIKKSEGRDLALRIRTLRVHYNSLISETSSLKENTAEGQADNERFHYLASVCMFNEDGSLVFEDVEDYLNHGNDPHIAEAAGALAEMEYTLDPDWEKKLPENEFLIKYNYVNEELSLVNKDNKRIDLDGRLINEEGMLVDEDGNLVDEEGKLIDQTKTEPVFFDDEPEEETPKKTRTRATRTKKKPQK